MIKTGFLAAFLLALSWPANGCLFAEEILYVIDGDTVVLANAHEEHVRLIGIDAPEIDHPDYGRKGEPYGTESADYLRSLVGGKTVRLEGGSESKDKYGRTLAYLYLPDGLFVNRQMVESGYAETFRRFDFTYKQEFLDLEKKARAEKRGMWRERPNDWKEQFQHWLSARTPQRKQVSHESSVLSR